MLYGPRSETAQPTKSNRLIANGKPSTITGQVQLDVSNASVQSTATSLVIKVTTLQLVKVKRKLVYNYVRIFLSLRDGPLYCQILSLLLL